jgi:PAS domain S-box-containing protein
MREPIRPPPESVIRVAPPGETRARAADDPPGRTPEEREQLLKDVADALRANLARGFLEGEERIREIAEALHDVVLLSDETGDQVFFVNAAYEQIWGRPRMDLYVTPEALLDGVHPDDRERVRGTLFRRANRDYDLEFRILRPSGDERCVRTRGFPVRSADGRIIRIASITEDITEHKEVVESHERLIRGFTHDVKNPLGAADGYLALLEAGVFGEMSEAQGQAVGRARRSIRIGLTLVSSLLEIERAEAGRLQLEREPVDVGAAVADVVEEFQAAATEKHMSLTTPVDAADDSLVLASDDKRVRQILANLVSNAVKYTHANGRVSVTPHVGSAHEAAHPGHWVVVDVADNGPGIPLEKQGLVFREFTRFDPGAAAGSGIGLTISQRLARALGGEITFSSTPDVGSTFTLWLPFEPPPAPTERRLFPRE